MAVLTEEEAKQIEIAIKTVMMEKSITLKKLVSMLNDKYGSKDTSQALSKSIREGTLSYWKAKRIADVLGYEIIWKQKDN